MDNLENLLILLLVGIFSFAIATLFRSNKALERVGEVEKEVKKIEGEMVHTEPVVEKIPEASASEVPVSSEVPSEDTGPFPKITDVHMN